MGVRFWPRRGGRAAVEPLGQRAAAVRTVLGVPPNQNAVLLLFARDRHVVGGRSLGDVRQQPLDPGIRTPVFGCDPQGVGQVPGAVQRAHARLVGRRIPQDVRPDRSSLSLLRDGARRPNGPAEGPPYDVHDLLGIRGCVAGRDGGPQASRDVILEDEE